MVNLSKRKSNRKIMGGVILTKITLGVNLNLTLNLVWLFELEVVIPKVQFGRHVMYLKFLPVLFNKKYFSSNSNETYSSHKKG